MKGLGEKKKHKQHPLGSTIIIHLVFFFSFRRLGRCQLPEELSSGYFVLITTKELADFNDYGACTNCFASHIPADLERYFFTSPPAGYWCHTALTCDSYFTNSHIMPLSQFTLLTIFVLFLISVTINANQDQGLGFLGNILSGNTTNKAMNYSLVTATWSQIDCLSFEISLILLKASNTRHF